MSATGIKGTTKPVGLLIMHTASKRPRKRKLKLRLIGLMYVLVALL